MSMSATRMSRVFIGGLTYRVRERDVERFFRKYGRITDVAMKNGFAFVEFEDWRDAEDAITELNGKELLGERVSVEIARGTPHGSDKFVGGSYKDRGGRDSRNDSYNPKRSNYRVIVENLSSRIDWRELKEIMRAAGEVCYANAHSQRMNTGVVEFASISHMKSAITMFDDTELKGRRIRLVQEYKGVEKLDVNNRSRSSKSRSRSRSKQRSRSTSHSKSRDRS